MPFECHLCAERKDRPALSTTVYLLSLYLRMIDRAALSFCSLISMLTSICSLGDMTRRRLRKNLTELDAIASEETFLALNYHHNVRIKQVSVGH